MNPIRSIKKNIIASIAALFVITAVMAQDATAPKTVNSGYNQLAILLLIITIVLAFVIWGLGQMLIVLSRQLLDKNKSTVKITAAIIITTLLFASQTSFANDTSTDVVKVLPNYGGLSATSFYMFVTVLAVEVIAILFLAFSIRRIYTELLPQKETAVKKFRLRQWWKKLDEKFFTRAIPVEREADLMLDHDYDGIKELDNALPPWWKYGFYITIAVAIIYLLNFHVLGIGKNPTEEYVAEMEKARVEKEIFEASNKDKIDEQNVPMADAAGLARAKEIFNTKCNACHGKLGEGGAGPNLTDDYWLHNGSLNDIFYTIKAGYPDKGMQSWSTDFTPKEISFLASYIKTLRGTNPPNAKAPQGDLFTEALSTTVTDSTAKSTADTAVTKKPASGKKNPDNATAKNSSQK
jgi:cytochrome c oxidase cbb3-type subunit III